MDRGHVSWFVDRGFLVCSSVVFLFCCQYSTGFLFYACRLSNLVPDRALSVESSDTIHGTGHAVTVMGIHLEKQ